MRIKGAGVLVVTVVALLMSGCSSSGDAGGASGSAGEAASVEAADAGDATPPPAATVEQWASRIAQLKSGYDNANASWEAATCSALAVPDALDCQGHMVTMTFIAQTAQITLTGLQLDGGMAYLGSAPEEIADLLAQTTDAAQAASAGGAALACPGDDCIGTAATFERAWDALGDAYAGWSPYL